MLYNVIHKKMKKIFIIIMLVSVNWVNAQTDRSTKGEHLKEMRQKMKEMPPEQKAELKTKRLTLWLDLNESQQKKMQFLQLELARDAAKASTNKKSLQEMTATELFEAKNKKLEQKIRQKEEMKKLLTEEQYSKWEKGKSRMALRHGKHSRTNARMLQRY